MLLAPPSHVNSWRLALAIERYILRKFRELLVHTHTVRVIPRVLDAEAILSVSEDLMDRARSRDHNPSLIAIAGPLEADVVLDFWEHPKVIPDWDLKDMPRTVWILGSYQGVPVLQFTDAAALATYVVDLAGFAALTRYDDVDSQITEISSARVDELLRQNPDIIKVPSGVPDTWDERSRQLQLRVELRLYESHQLESMESSAGICATAQGL